MFSKPDPIRYFVERQPRLADYSPDSRMLPLAAMTLVVGSSGAWLLLRLIALVNSLAWFGRLSAPEQIVDILPRRDLLQARVQQHRGESEQGRRLCLGIGGRATP
jgi:hypothetical protein